MPHSKVLIEYLYQNLRGLLYLLTLRNFMEASSFVGLEVFERNTYLGGKYEEPELVQINTFEAILGISRRNKSLASD